MKWKSYLHRTYSGTFARWRTLSRVGLCSASLLCWAGNGSADTVDAIAAEVGQMNDVWFPRLVDRVTRILLEMGYTGTVTNFLGEDTNTDFYTGIEDAVYAAIQDALGFPPNGWNGYVKSVPFMWPSEGAYSIGEYLLPVFGVYPGQSPPHGLLEYQGLILDELQASSASNGVVASSNLVELAALREELSGIGATVEDVPTSTEMDYANEGQTYSNAVPVAALSFGNVEVETSPLEQSIGGLEGSLDGMAIQTTTQVPVILIKGGQDRIEAPLDLSDLRAVTAICRVLWRVLLFVGVLGIIRSEWDYWTTLGGSAT